MPAPAEMYWYSRWLLVGLGGAVGSVLRYEASRWTLGYAWGRSFPVGTLLVNVVGGFLLGLIAVLILQRLPQEQHHGYLLLGIGFCGGFTTFSTFSSETHRLLLDGRYGIAGLYVLASVLGGLLAVMLGVALGHYFGQPHQSG